MFRQALQLFARATKTAATPKKDVATKLPKAKVEAPKPVKGTTAAAPKKSKK